MNEQQLADLFSEQIDQMLSGEEFSLPAEATEIEELLELGQQVSQVQFQAAPAAQAAFQGLVASWFSSGGGASVALWGLSKGWGIGLGAAAIVGALGLGALFLANPQNEPGNIDTQSTPVQEVETLPDTVDSNPDQPVDEAPSDETVEDPIEKSSSTGDTIVPPKPSSLSDKLPVTTPSLGDTLVLPTDVSTETLSAGTENGDEIGAGTGDKDNNVTSGTTNTGGNGDTPSKPEDDRGHGNDPGGYDPDNPGKSSGVPDKDSEPNLGRGKGDSSSGGSNSSGGKDNSNKKDKNENRGNNNK